MLRGGSPAASPFSLWRPLELLVEETMQEELEVKEMEFEEDRMEVVRWWWIPTNSRGVGWVPAKSREVAGTEAFDSAFE